MKNIIKLHATAVGVSVLFYLVMACVNFTVWAADANVPGGSYKATCKDIRFDKTADTIRASCKKMDGSWNNAAGMNHYSLCFKKQGDIENCDGSLYCTGAGIPSGSYTRSCFCCFMTGKHLICHCKKKNGKFVRSTLKNATSCTSVGNNNGELVCR